MRSAGQSAIASVAYRAGERLYSSCYGEVSDYTKKGGVIASKIMPVLLYQLPLSLWMVQRKLSMYLLIETGLLLLLLFVGDITGGGGWFFTAALGVLLGTGLVFLPVILEQCLRGLPLYRHKALLYFSVETLFLLLLLFVTDLGNGLESFWKVSLPTALLCLALPWGVMAVVRYLPVNGWLRASAASAWMGLWLWLGPAVFDRIMIPLYGEPNRPYTLWIPYDFSQWNFAHRPWNIIMLLLLAFGVIALVCGGIGIKKQYAKR